MKYKVYSSLNMTWDMQYYKWIVLMILNNFIFIKILMNYFAQQKMIFFDKINETINNKNEKQIKIKTLIK